MVILMCPEIAGVCLIVVPILCIGLFLIITRSRPVFERVYKLYDKLNGVVRKNLHGNRVVKAFAREERCLLLLTGFLRYAMRI